MPAYKAEKTLRRTFDGIPHDVVDHVILTDDASGDATAQLAQSLGPLDSFLNAAMILSGMGPLHNPKTDAGKIFAGLYALYSGFAVLVIAGVTFAPAIHRVLHRFHLADDQDEANEEASDKKREGKRAKAARK